MLERETKREKILEARQREIRLKERSRSEQSRSEDGGREDGDDSPDQLIARAERDFHSMVETELRRRRDRVEQTNRVRTTHTSPSFIPSVLPLPPASSPSFVLNRFSVDFSPNMKVQMLVSNTHNEPLVMLLFIVWS